MNCSQVVDLSHLVVERLFHEPIRLDVPFHLAQAFDTLNIAGHALLFSEEFVLGEPLDEVEHLEDVEVQEAQLTAEEIVFLS